MDQSLPTDHGSGPFEQAPPQLALTFDAAEFAAFVADFDLTEAQKAELLETLWVIMVGFVDLGFRINPVQQAMPQCGMRKSVRSDRNPMLGSQHSISIEHLNLGAGATRTPGEG